MPTTTNLRLPDFAASAAGAAAGGPPGPAGGGASAGIRLVSSATEGRSCSPEPGAWPEVSRAASPSAVSASGRIARAAWSLAAAIPASSQTMPRAYGQSLTGPVGISGQTILTERFGQYTFPRDGT